MAAVNDESRLCVCVCVAGLGGGAGGGWCGQGTCRLGRLSGTDGSIQGVQRAEIRVGCSRSSTVAPAGQLEVLVHQHYKVPNLVFLWRFAGKMWNSGRYFSCGSVGVAWILFALLVSVKRLVESFYA